MVSTVSMMNPIQEDFFDPFWGSASLLSVSGSEYWFFNIYLLIVIAQLLRGLFIKLYPNLISDSFNHYGA